MTVISILCFALWTAGIYHIAWSAGWKDHMKITDEADARYFRKRGWIK